MAKRTTSKKKKTSRAKTTKRPTKKATSAPDLSHIAEPLRAYAIPIDGLRLDPDNARMHNKRNLETIRDMLDRFGQRRPIIVQKQGMIVRAGNGRTLVARERLGWTHIAAVVVDESDVEAAAFALADNRTAELADWDSKQLAETLGQLTAQGYNLDAIGFLKYETDPLFDADWDAISAGATESRPVETSHAHTITLTHDQRDMLDAITDLMSTGGDEPTDIDAAIRACEFYMGATDE